MEDKYAETLMTKLMRMMVITNKNSSRRSKNKHSKNKNRSKYRCLLILIDSAGTEREDDSLSLILLLCTDQLKHILTQYHWCPAIQLSESRDIDAFSNRQVFDGLCYYIV